MFAVGDDANDPRRIGGLWSRQGESVQQTASSSPRTRPFGRWQAAVVVALVCLAGGAGYAVWPRTAADPTGSTALVAVLPFENLSGDAAQQYFSDGITDELITQLARIHPTNVKVVARTSTLRYRDSRKTASEIGRELGVQHLIEGTVRRSGTRVRIGAQLIRVSDQSHLWAEVYEGDLSDILVVQQEIGRAILRQVLARLSVAATPPRSVDPDVYDLYLRGRLYWNRRTAPDLQRAIASFEEALRRDPTFALAYAGIGDCHMSSGNMTAALATAEKALSLDDRLAEAHVTRGHALMHQLRWAEAEPAFQRAIELDPSYPPARYYYGEYLVSLGWRGEAVNEAQQALVVDPMSAITTHAAGVIAYYAGAYDLAQARLRKALDLNPTHQWTNTRLALVHERRAQFSEAIAEFERAGRPMRSVYAFARGGRAADARRIIADTLASPTRDTEAYHLAAAFVGLGEHAAALKWLSLAVRRKDYDVIYMKVDPRLEPLRSRPEFAALLKAGGWE